MTTPPLAKSHAHILKVLGGREMSAALIASKLGLKWNQSRVHTVAYKMMCDGLLARSHNGRGWVYFKK